MPRPKRRATNTTAELASEERVQPSSKRAKKIPKGEQNFSQTRLITWFKKYTTDDPSILGPHGMERFCEDINLEPENIVMLIIAYKMGAQKMGFFSQSEWVRGLADPEIQCDSPAKLQNKLGYLFNLMNDPHIFKMIFRYAYDFARVCRLDLIDFNIFYSELIKILG